MTQLKLQTVNLLFSHSKMTKDFTGVRQQLKSNLHYHLFSHSDHPVAENMPLQAVPHAGRTGQAPSVTVLLRRIHGGRTSYPEEKLVRCLSAQLQYSSLQYVSQLIKNLITSNGHLMARCGQNQQQSTCTQSYPLPSPLLDVPVLVQLWKLTVWRSDVETETKLNCAMPGARATVCQFVRLLCTTSAFSPEMVILFLL